MASRQLYVGTLGTLLVFLDGLITTADREARQYETDPDGEPGEDDAPPQVLVFRPEQWEESGIEETTLLLIDAIFDFSAGNPAIPLHDSQKRTYKGLLKRAEPYRA